MKWSMSPQVAMAVLIIVVYASIVWHKARDLTVSTGNALVTVTAAAAVLLFAMWLLRCGGFW